MNWQRMDLLSQRYAANLRALSQRVPRLASAVRDYLPVMLHVLSTDGDRLQVGQVAGQQVSIIPCRLDAEGARQVAMRLCPAGRCDQPILVAGLEQGWLWDALYSMPVNSPARPGYRPPLYFLARSIESLWIAMHIHDWRTMLADPRTIIVAGPDAVDQLRDLLLANPRLAPPKVSVTLDPAIWPSGTSFDPLNAKVMADLNRRMAEAMEELKAMAAPLDDRTIAARLAGSERLRILGLTSRYTTFLQHSMRDWLAAFAAEGHETALLIEQADHEQLNSLVVAEACQSFRPDVVLLIDHFRAELGGFPQKIPCVMWVQDHLPNILSPSAGKAQGPYDFAIGHARTECTTRFGYPPERFMAALVPVNDERFAPLDVSDEERRRFGCDLCYVGHASTPAETIIQGQIEQNPHARPLLEDAFERLRAIYEDGRSLSHPIHLRAVIQEAMRSTRMSLDAPSLSALTDVFSHRVNNAMFRHQALEWAAETGANLHLYGNGWENHPRLKRFARGPADNQTMLRKIFQCARINLQATPHGVVHQRLLEGLASGGFFLIRYVPGDMLGRIYPPLWDWIVREGIETDEQILARATPEIQLLLGEFQRTIGLDPFRLDMKLIDDVRTHAALGFCNSASALWPEYEQVAFDSRARLHQQISRFLANDAERKAIAASMRHRVLETLTYKATNRRMMRFITDVLARRAAPRTAAA